MRTAPALALLALGAFCISWAAVIVRWTDVGPSAIAFWRMAVAAVAMAALSIPARRRRPREVRGASAARDTGDGARVGSELPGGRALAFAALAGLLFAGDLWIWHKSILRVGAGMATLLANTQVFWVATLGAALLGERLGLRFGLLAAAALSGVALLTLPGIASAGLDPLGVGYGLTTGLLYGGYYLALREARRAERPLALLPNLALVAAVSAAALLVATIAEGDALLPPASEIPKLLLLGTLVHTGGWLAISGGMTHVAAARGSLVLVTQPVLATVWGILIYQEPFGAIEVVGAMVTLAAVYGAARVRATEALRPDAAR